jgi:creatinine amidohydrolase
MQLLELPWPRVNELSRELPVVIPIAAVEQHGHHLPVYTDSFLLGEVVRRAHEKVANKILLAPLQWLGNSEHHLDFPGTMTASPRAYLDLLRDMVGNFLFHGFKTIVLLNGHGGNMVPRSRRCSKSGRSTASATICG